MVIDGDGGEGDREMRDKRIRVSDPVDVGFDPQNVCVAVAVSVSMGARAEGEIGKPTPVLEVVAAFEV